MLKYNIAVRVSKSRTNQFKDVLLCLASQTNQNFSVTLCCDREILGDVEEYSSIYNSYFSDRIKIIEGHGNRAAKIIQLINNAEADYIVFLDDDDHITNNYIEEFESTNEVELKITKYVKRQYVYPNSYSEVSPGEIITLENPLAEFYDNYWPFCTVAFKLSFLRKIQISEEIEFLEDWAIIWSVLALGGRFSYSDKYTFIYNQHLTEEKLQEFSKSRNTFFNQKSRRDFLIAYSENKQLSDIVVEIDELFFFLSDQKNAIGKAADEYRKSFEILEDIKNRMEREKLYLILFKIRKLKNRIRAIFFQ